MDRIDLFRIFLRVVDGASFTRAAETLHLPRSTVSAAVQELENRMGTRLLARTTRKVAPTADGLAFYARCPRLIDDVDEVESLFRQSGSLPAGRLRVDMPGRIGRLIVLPALPGFLARYPEITVELGVSDRAVDLVEAGIDCTIRVGPLADSTLIARPVGDLPLINVASPAYLARRGAPATPAELGAHDAVLYASPSTGRVEPWEWQQDGVTHTRDMTGVVTVNSAEAQIAAAIAGLGLIQIPAYDVRTLLAANALVEVMPYHRAPPLPMALLYPSRRHLSRRIQVFADWLIPLLVRETRG